MSEPLAAVDSWLREFVVGQNICPFARAPYEGGGVHLALSTATTVDEAVAHVATELAALAERTESERSTTLAVIPAFQEDWDALRDVVGTIEALIEASGSEAWFQVVGFHPHAVYEGADPEDPANATARAPHPVVHLLRADAVERAIAAHPDPAGISEANAAILRGRSPTPTD